MMGAHNDCSLRKYAPRGDYIKRDKEGNSSAFKKRTFSTTHSAEQTTGNEGNIRYMRIAYTANFLDDYV